MGVGAAIRAGIDYALDARRYDYVIVMASNGKMRPRDIATLIQPIVSGEADYVQGSRYMKGGSSLELTPFRRVAVPVFTLLAGLMLRRRFSDVTCGFRAYRLAIFRNEHINITQPWLNQYELEYYLHYWVCRLNYRVKEVPVTMDYSHLRRDRKSKIAPLTGWWSMLRPFLFLSLGIKK